MNGERDHKQNYSHKHKKAWTQVSAAVVKKHSSLL